MEWKVRTPVDLVLSYTFRDSGLMVEGEIECDMFNTKTKSDF